MIIYNVTTKVHHTIHESWLEWMKNENIPAMLNTGCFTNAVVVRLLEVDDSEGPTYAVQYHAESKGAYNIFIEKYAAAMSKEGIKKWGDLFISYRSVMQVVN